MAEQTELDFAEFEELYLADASFSKRLEVSETPVEPKNLKDRNSELARYTQDSFDLFTSQTEIYNRLNNEFNLRWDGKIDKDGKLAGGMSSTTKNIFSWVRAFITQKDEIHKLMLGRAVQDRALLAAEVLSEYNELSRLYGNPGAAILNVIKNIQAHDETIKKAAAQMEDIMGQLKLGGDK